MKDADKDTGQLMNELGRLRQRVAKLQALEAEHKSVSEALQASEARYRALVGNAREIITVIQDNIPKFSNRRAVEILGYSLEELYSKPFTDFVHPDDRQRAVDGYLMALSGKKTRPEPPIRILGKRGNITWVEFSWSKIIWDGKPAVMYMISDVTEWKKMEQALRESEEQYRSLVELSPEAIFVASKGKHVFANSAGLRLLGASSPDQIIGKPVTDVIHPDYRKIVAERMRKAMETGVIPPPLEEKFIRLDGKVIDVEVRGTPLVYQGKMAMQVFISDITERKRAEEALRESEERYRLIAENASDVIWTADMNLKMTYISPSCINLHGYTPEEAVSLPFEEGLTRESYEKVMKIFSEALAKEAAGATVPGRTRSFEAEFIHKDGNIVWTETVVSFIRDETGMAIGILGVTRDIDARKRAEEAVRASEARYRLLAENIRDVIWSMDMDLRFTYVSPSVKYLGDRTAEEVMSMSLQQILTPSSQELIRKVLAKELAQAKVVAPSPRRSRTLEVEIVRRDGSILWSELRMAFIRGPDGQPVGILGVMRDITERRQIEEERMVMEQKAQLASRLASVGELAAGIAHEVNNPLTGVIGYAELLMREDVPEHIRDGLEVIHEGAKRVVGIVRGLLTFARRTKPERALVDINQIVETTLRLRAYELQTSNIKVITELDPDLSITFADPGQLQQVFLNLVINAETEMGLAYGEGKLVVKTEQIDNTIRISFKDDGPGIAEENIGRIFDPFFTTREIGKGTGLGLSVCHGILNEHGGRIWAESELGKGAVFIVELPIVSGMERPKRAKLVRKAGKVARAKAKILVVDDELAVRQLLSQLLIEEGHEVDTAYDGKDALDMIKSNRYSLILLDIKLPGMSGSELYERVRGIAKSLANRVVFITGDLMGADTEAFLARTKAPYITKPFDIELLSSKVNRLLAKRHSTRSSSKS